jgi:DNA polymerase V
MRKTVVHHKEFIQSGFTSPADEYAVPDINLDHEFKNDPDNTSPHISLNSELQNDPEATYPARMDSKAMEKVGIMYGARLMYQRGVIPKNGDIVYVWHDNEKLIRFYNKQGNDITLYAPEPGYPVIRGKEGDEIILIGVITFSFICHLPRLFPNIKKW